MSRHRRFNGSSLDYDNDSHSGSFTDDEPVYGASPNTMALYMFDETKAGNSRDISNFINFNPCLEINEDCFPDHEDVFDDKCNESLKVTVNISNSIPITSHLEKVNIKPTEIIQKPSKFNEDISKKECSQIRELATTQPVMISNNSLLKNPTDRFKEQEINNSRSASEERKRKPLKLTKDKGPYDPSDALQLYSEQRMIDKERPLINLISIGHVDAGKSTLMGHLLCQMNYVSSKKLAKYKHESKKSGKSSFVYAWVLDESEEERNRGVTTDVAQTYFETKNRRIQLMDAPGHRDFIPSMIGGAAQADSAILVINATRGEFETGFELGGQTQEHTYLVRVLGVSNVIVAVNKMDTVDWDEARFNEIRDKVSRFMKQLKLKCVFCPCSGLLGINIAPGTGKEQCKQLAWYRGESLVELIDQLEAPERAVHLPVRISVTDVYKPFASSSFVVSGRVEAGCVQTGSKLIFLPANQAAVVKSIKMNSGTVIDEAGTVGEIAVQSAFDGDHVVLSLSGIDVSACSESGSFLSHSEYIMPCSNRIQSKLLIFGLNSENSLTRNSCVTFYYQNLSIPAYFEKIHSLTVSNTSGSKGPTEKKNPRVIPGGSKSCSAIVDLFLNKVICIESAEVYRNIGKFTLRDRGVTIAGGTVVKVLKQRNSKL